MKNIIPLTILLLIVVLAACSPKAAPTDTNAIYTEAAMTVFVQFTEDAAKIPTLTPAPANSNS